MSHRQDIEERRDRRGPSTRTSRSRGPYRPRESRSHEPYALWGGRSLEEDDPDEEAVVFAPGLGGPGATLAHPPPSIIYLDSYLGYPTRDRSKCWGCKSGRANSTAVSLRRYNEMINMYRRGRIDTDPVVLAIELFLFFEFFIRRPANKFKMAHQPEIPIWSARDIYEHMRKHIKEASNRIYVRLDQVTEAIDTIYENGLYKPVKNVMGNWVPMVRKKYIEPFLDLIKEERALAKLEPSKMFMFSNEYSITTSEVATFINKRKGFYLENPPSYVLAEEVRTRK